MYVLPFGQGRTNGQVCESVRGRAHFERCGRPLGPAVGGGGALGLVSFPRSDVRAVVQNNGIQESGFLSVGLIIRSALGEPKRHDSIIT
jgi:hypothetical protein